LRFRQPPVERCSNAGSSQHPAAAYLGDRSGDGRMAPHRCPADDDPRRLTVSDRTLGRHWQHRWRIRKGKPGQLGPQVEGLPGVAGASGYRSQTVRRMLTELCLLGRWMSDEGVVSANLYEDTMVAFLAAPQTSKRRRSYFLSLMFQP
jgi:hypothetical protein